MNGKFQNFYNLFVIAVLNYQVVRKSAYVIINEKQNHYNCTESLRSNWRIVVGMGSFSRIREDKICFTNVMKRNKRERIYLKQMTFFFFERSLNFE